MLWGSRTKVAKPLHSHDFASPARRNSRMQTTLYEYTPALMTCSLFMLWQSVTNTPSGEWCRSTAFT